MPEVSKRPLPTPKIAPPTPECTCPLVDTSVLGGEISYIRGDPEGCERHDVNNRARKRAEAEYRARYGDEALEQVRERGEPG